jgi:hypothetical protein
MKHIHTFEGFLNENLNEAKQPNVTRLGIDENYKSNEMELKNYLNKKHPGFEMYSAENGEIMVGFLRKPNDTTWNNVMTYYWNTNYELDDVSVKKIKI